MTNRRKPSVKAEPAKRLTLDSWSIYNPPRNGGKTGAERLIKYYPAAYAQLLGLVEMGVSQSVAAASIGVTPTTFSRWLRDGMEAPGHTCLGRFARDIMAARARATATAEIAVKKQNPLAWLRANASDAWRDEGSTGAVSVSGGVTVNQAVYLDNPEGGDVAKTLDVLHQIGLLPDPTTLAAKANGDDDTLIVEPVTD